MKSMIDSFINIVNFFNYLKLEESLREINFISFEVNFMQIHRDCFDW